jgi:uncharacterized protein YdhG (YjbR/CyaY superfamily)
MSKIVLMKKARSAKTGRTKSVETVEEYLAAVPEPARSTLKKVRATIRSVVPAETAEVISYGIPAFKHKTVLVWYAAFADHCSLFPTASVIEKFKQELKGYRVSKGTIRFGFSKSAKDKPLPAALLKKMVKARLVDVEGGKRLSG